MTRRALLGLLLPIGLGLGGCGLQPMYAGGSHGVVARTLSDVEMMEIDVFVHHAMEITRAEVDAQRREGAAIVARALGVWRAGAAFARVVGAGHAFVAVLLIPAPAR